MYKRAGRAARKFYIGAGGQRQPDIARNLHLGGRGRAKSSESDTPKVAGHGQVPRLDATNIDQVRTGRINGSYCTRVALAIAQQEGDTSGTRVEQGAVRHRDLGHTRVAKGRLHTIGDIVVGHNQQVAVVSDDTGIEQYAAPGPQRDVTARATRHRNDVRPGRQRDVSTGLQHHVRAAVGDRRNLPRRNGHAGARIVGISLRTQGATCATATARAAGIQVHPAIVGKTAAIRARSAHQQAVACAQFGYRTGVEVAGDLAYQAIGPGHHTRDAGCG